MRRIALHWQILIGMVLGTLLGVALNLTVSERTTRMEANESGSMRDVLIEDAAGRTIITYNDADGQAMRHVIEPLSQDPDAVPDLKQLKVVAPEAAALYLAEGQSYAKAIGGWFNKLGGLFLRMLKMVAIPLIIASLMSGIMNLGGGQGVGRMFSRTLIYYLCTSMLAIMTGLAMVNILRPGLSMDQVNAVANDVKEAKPLQDVLFEQVEAMIPANPLAALAEPNYLSIIAFTILFGLFTLRVGGATADAIKAAAETVFSVMMAMTTAIIALAPIGVFFLIAAITATQGLDVFLLLGKYVIAVAAALAVHACITLPLILWLVAKRNPLHFAKAMSPALLTAFSSASSNGTLPLTMSSVEQRAGVSNKTGSFVLPLGATINMDGTALYEVVAVLFIAQLHFGVNLPLSGQIVVALTALLASVGAAGIPHAGLVMMAIILQAVGLPAELQGIILAVDRVLDMGRTAVNVWSDSCGCAVVDAYESETVPAAATLVTAEG